MYILSATIESFVEKTVDYFPRFVLGIVIIGIGIIVSLLIKNAIRSGLRFFRLFEQLREANLLKGREAHLWERIILEIIRLTTIVIFLIPALDIWGMSGASAVLSKLLLFIPNIAIAGAIGFGGSIASHAIAEFAAEPLKSKKHKNAGTVALIIRIAILFFTILIVLSQIGIAQDFIRIMFTGIVAALALAFGLAFGLGGKEEAKNIIAQILAKLNQSS